MKILQTENLKKYYKTGENVVKAVDGVNLEVERGEYLAIVGKSGSGEKHTFTFDRRIGKTNGRRDIL